MLIKRIWSLTQSCKTFNIGVQMIYLLLGYGLSKTEQLWKSYGTLDRYYLEHNRNKEVISLSFCRQKCILLIKHYKKLHLNACSLIKIFNMMVSGYLRSEFTIMVFHSRASIHRIITMIYIYHWIHEQSFVLGLWAAMRIILASIFLCTVVWARPQSVGAYLNLNSQTSMYLFSSCEIYFYFKVINMYNL